MSIMKRILVLIACWVPLICSAATLDLTGEWKQPKNSDSENISLGFGEINRAGWGGYSPNERKYFKERLPCYFERTLTFEKMDWNRGIDWVFTGPREGFNIEIRNGEVTFYHKYYDSKGFDQLEKPEVRSRYPLLGLPPKTFQVTG